MKVAIHDADQTSFPNLALMKLSAHHKANGDEVEFYEPLFAEGYDLVHSSKVFTFGQRQHLFGHEINRGGSGYVGLMKARLESHIEHTCPDYELYHGITYSMGFLTRGCFRRCPHCIVPEKEGDIRAHADIEEFTRHRDVVLLDNNVLACKHGIDQIEKIARLGLRVDFNQGLDARLIDSAIARRLAAVKWRAPIRLACDHVDQLPAVKLAVELLRWHNATPRRYQCYVLITDIEEALERIRALKGIDVDPFAQPFRAPDGMSATAEQRQLARWVNHKAVFKACTWQQYKADVAAGGRKA